MHTALKLPTSFIQINHCLKEDNFVNALNLASGLFFISSTSQ